MNLIISTLLVKAIICNVYLTYLFVLLQKDLLGASSYIQSVDCKETTNVNLMYSKPNPHVRIVNSTLA